MTKSKKTKLIFIVLLWVLIFSSTLFYVFTVNWQTINGSAETIFNISSDSGKTVFTVFDKNFSF